MVGADGDRVIPRGEALVAVGVGRGVQHQDHRLEQLQGLRLIGPEHLIRDLHRGFEPCGLVPVDGVLEDRHGGVLRGDLRGPRGRRTPRIGQLREVGADLVEPRDIRRVGDDQRPDGTMLARLAPPLHAGAVAGSGDERIEVVLQHGIHRVLLARGVAGDDFGTGDGGPVGAPRVKIEALLGAEAGCRADDEPGQQYHCRAHESLRGAGGPPAAPGRRRTARTA